MPLHPHAVSKRRRRTLMRSMDETMQALRNRARVSIWRFPFEKGRQPAPVRGASFHRGAMVQARRGPRMERPARRSSPLARCSRCRAARAAQAVVNLFTGDIRRADAQVLTSVGNRALFAQAFFAMAGNEIHQGGGTGRRAGDCRGCAVRDGHLPMLTPMVKRAMKQIHRGKGRDRREGRGGGGFPLRPRARGDHRAGRPPDSGGAARTRHPGGKQKRVVAQLQRVKIKTDTGISITPAARTGGRRKTASPS